MTGGDYNKLNPVQQKKANGRLELVKPDRGLSFCQTLKKNMSLKK